MSDDALPLHVLYGDKAIVGYLAEIGVDVNVRTVQRWRARGEDPLPHHNFCDGSRGGRIAADPEQVAAWVRRNLLGQPGRQETTRFPGG